MSTRIEHGDSLKRTAPPELDAIARKVLAYKPKPKTKAAKARKRRATKAQKPK